MLRIGGELQDLARAVLVWWGEIIFRFNLFSLFVLSLFLLSESESEERAVLYAPVAMRSTYSTLLTLYS